VYPSDVSKLKLNKRFITDLVIKYLVGFQSTEDIDGNRCLIVVYFVEFM